jgi:hypothetical protein
VRFTASPTVLSCCVAPCRAVQLWSLGTAELLYRSAVITSSGTISLATDPQRPRVVVGCGDGSVRIIDVWPRDTTVPGVDGGGGVFCRVTLTLRVHDDMQRLLGVDGDGDGGGDDDDRGGGARPTVISRQLAWDKLPPPVWQRATAAASKKHTGDGVTQSPAIIFCHFVSGACAITVVAVAGAVDRCAGCVP